MAEQGSPGFLAASTANVLRDLPRGHTHAHVMEGKKQQTSEMLSSSRFGCLFHRSGRRASKAASPREGLQRGVTLVR